MITFQSFDAANANQYRQFLANFAPRGCEYNFANLYCWGRQKMAVCGESIAFFSQFNRKTVYPFPLGKDLKTTLDAIIHDARARGIPCRLTGMTQEDCQLLEALYPGRFRIHADRDGSDYVYDIQDLSQLKGRKYQKKRNHINRFLQNHPNHRVVSITAGNIPSVKEMVELWYAQRLAADPMSDFHMERSAIHKALENFEVLGMEGLLLQDGEKVLAMTMGSFLFPDTFDVQFEKALEEADGAYPAINWYFARYLQEKYPQLIWLDREEDMGLEGLRKAKLSYCPHHLQHKNWACLLEDGYDY